MRILGSRKICMHGQCFKYQISVIYPQNYIPDNGYPVIYHDMVLNTRRHFGHHTDEE